MPFIQISLIEGRTAEEKAALIKEVSEAAMRTVNATPDNTRVVIYEVTADEWGVGGQTVTQMRAGNSSIGLGQLRLPQ
jgi:4-oxalocrotonate tautomerase